MANRRSQLALFLLAVVLCPAPAGRAQTDTQAARKYDEFGDILPSDLAARLDGFASELQSRPDARAFVVAYRGRRDPPGLSGSLVSLMKEYLIETRGLAAERIVAVDGGVAGCLTQELWVVPVGATPTPRKDAYQSNLEDTDSARKFDEAGVTSDNSYSRTIYHSLEGFARALRREPRSNGYLVGYAAYWVSRWKETNTRGATRTHTSVHLDPPGEARRLLAGVKAALVKQYGVRASRIKLMDGGYRKWSQMELWIVPRGGHAPIPTPSAFPKGRR